MRATLKIGYWRQVHRHHKPNKTKAKQDINTTKKIKNEQIYEQHQNILQHKDGT